VLRCGDEAESLVEAHRGVVDGVDDDQAGGGFAGCDRFA
jgi:hypothetical protein